MRDVRQDLRLLAIFHYILAGLTALLSLLPTLHIAMGIAILRGDAWMTQTGPRPPSSFGWLFIAAGAAFMFGGFAYSALLALAGRFLQTERHWMYCMVMAGISCALFPFGTVLGVFTIVVLARDDVKALFGRVLPSAPAAPGWSDPRR